MVVICAEHDSNDPRGAGLAYSGYAALLLASHLALGGHRGAPAAAKGEGKGGGGPCWALLPAMALLAPGKAAAQVWGALRACGAALGSLCARRGTAGKSDRVDAGRV